jgi:hypothetical protein
MFKRAIIVTAVVCASALSTPAPAQAGPTWNRKIEAISVMPVPAGGGFFDVTVYLSVEASGAFAGPLDLGTQALVLRNSSALGVLSFEVSAQPAGGEVCGGGCDFPEVCHCGTNPATGVFSCQCGPFLAWASTSGALQPGDEITVIIYPAPGAVPESDQSDDERSMSFNGEALSWNRTILGATVVPASGGSAGGSLFDIFVDVAIEANYEGLLRLPSVAGLRLNGSVVEEAPLDSLDLDLAWNQCAVAACDDSIACVMDPSGPFLGTCQPDEDGPFACGCLYHPEPDIVFPSMHLSPGDEITVIIYPAPGALPSLPGFPDDDSIEVQLPGLCPADVSGDSIVDVQDIVAIILDWGCTSPPDDCPGDVNDDGSVDVADLVAAILAWGPCGE